MEKYNAVKNNMPKNDGPAKSKGAEPHKAQGGNSPKTLGGDFLNTKSQSSQQMQGDTLSDGQEEEAPQKSQDQINAENNANNIRNIAEVAANMNNPYAKAAGYAVKGLDKLTGGKSTEAMGKAINRANKFMPGGQLQQKVANKMSESGATEMLAKGAKAKSGGGSAAKGAISSKSSSSGSSSSSNGSSMGGGISKLASLKLKLILVCVAFLFVVLMGTFSATAAQDNANLDITNKAEMSRKSASAANVMGALEEVANWYIQNVQVYSQSTYFQSPFSTQQVRADCSGFAVAYMSHVAGSDVPSSYTGEMVYPDGSWANTVEALGWMAFTSDEINDLQPGDVLISHVGASYSTKGQHVEIYVDENNTFGWGSVKTSYPTPNSITPSEFNGHNHFMDSTHDYVTIYRYAGAVSIGDMNIIDKKDDSFKHGDKPKTNQKYIMLHDTEMSGTAEEVVESWKNSGNGVAAHFVVDRDGTIIQAVDMDTIAHHAGFGGPGDYDSMFNVGNNDGTGNGDDLVGTVPLAGYTSYGMNSYSIGIELCHVNGEDYPEEQLKALDKLIMYIDNYYGFKAEIIDHKAWRPSNSDTDAKFSTYLNNYKNLRHY